MSMFGMAIITKQKLVEIANIIFDRHVKMLKLTNCKIEVFYPGTPLRGKPLHLQLFFAITDGREFALIVDIREEIHRLDILLLQEYLLAKDLLIEINEDVPIEIIPV